MNIPETLKQFYDAMFETQKIRSLIVTLLSKNRAPDRILISQLENALESLENIPRVNGQCCLRLDAQKTISLNPSYEINELKKDIYFITHPIKDFYNYLARVHSDFEKEVDHIIHLIRNKKILNFITDRDGTINNYCGRYTSSIQSIYNAFFLTNFARKYCKNAVILTSAPLDNIGLLDMSVAPAKIFIYAGSCGRDILTKQGKRIQLGIPEPQREKIAQLNARLTDLVKQPDYEKFSLIGSGLQFKFGQTLIARQDITKTIPEEESLALKTVIENCVRDIDPEQKFFHIEDTGNDLEVTLTTSQPEDSNSKMFDKGDGVDFMDETLNLNLRKGSNLICGDTSADIFMLAAAVKKSSNTYAIFVTTDTDLKQKVKAVCSSSLFISSPDVLVTALHRLGDR